MDLISTELAEHHRWAAAGEAVGAASSGDRAAFIAGQVGSGAGEGFGTGFVTGLVTTIGIQALEAGLQEVAGVAIPGVGQVIGGVMSAYALVSGWNRNVTAISHMGEGRSGYEEAANDIEGVCAVLDIASNVVNVIAGVVGIVAVASAAAALVTLGALSPLAITAGSIAAAIGVAGMVLGLVKMALQPLVLLFRALHTFTSQADPREIEGQGHTLNEGAREMGGALGGLAGAAAAGLGKSHSEEVPPTGDEPPPPESLPPADEPPVVEAEPASGASIELDPDAAPIGGEPLEPHPVELTPGEGATPGLDEGAGPIGGEPLDPHQVELPPGEGGPIELDTGPEVWPEEYNVPTASEPPTVVELSNERAQGMLDIAESGDARGFHTDQELFDLHQDAAGRRQPGPMGDPRNEFNNLRNRLDRPAGWEGPIHHEQFPINEYPGQALEPDNLYATRTGSSAHRDFHRTFGAQGTPYARMAPGFEEPGMQNLFDFANTAPDNPPIPAGAPAAPTPTTPGYGEVSLPPGDGGPIELGPTAPAPAGGSGHGEVSLPPGDGGPIELGPGGPTESVSSDYGNVDLPPAAGPTPELAAPQAPPSTGSPSSGPRSPAATRAARAQLLARAQTAARLAEAEHRRRERGGAQSGNPHTDRSAPVVESVDPAYQNPPGTKAQIEQFTRDIARLRAARAQASQREQRAGQVQQAAQAQGAQVQQAQQQVTDASGATQQHQTQVQQHQQANEQSSQQHQEGGAKVEDATSQLAGIATLETLLGGWSGFTGLVLRFQSVLPDSAVNAFRQMNRDSTTFMAKLVETKRGVAAQQSQQGPRGAEIAQQAGRIATTGTQAQATAEQLNQHQGQAARLTQVNQQNVAVAEADRTRAANNRDRADTSAATLEQRQQTLADQMAAWAAEHKEARRRAVEQTAQRLEARHLRVTRRSE